ncbi:hypothetical protein ACJMK2_043396 [Sinanodonta woodiana]|uniref:Uncharacterized protein n=1 Tax=Sinanodonta woodiana TaxID=1069815 RepID=A0ABD3VXI4_SINWO
MQASHGAYIALVLAIAGIVSCFSSPILLTYDDPFQDTGDKTDGYLLYSKDFPLGVPDAQYNEIPFITRPFDVDKRNKKRSPINELIQKLIALYGTNEITYSGRSLPLRFGPGKRRK